MPPSVDSCTCTASACLTRSTPKKRNSCCSKVITEDLRKKSRGSSSLSETSPRRSDNLDLMGQLTQESRKKRSSPDNEAYVQVDLPSGQPHQSHFPSTQKNDDFLKRAPFGKDERLASGDLDRTVRSMILHIASLTRSILVAYDKEREHENRGSSAFMTELAQQRTFNEAVSSELARMRTIHEAGILELSQLRISNEAAAAEVANLQMENANLVKKEAEASSMLEEFQRQCAMRGAVNIIAAFMMSKALILQEHAQLDKAGSSEINKLRFQKAQIIKETRDVEERRRLQILSLQSSLVAAEKELTKLRSKNAELMKEKDEREAKTSSAIHDMLCRLEAANEEAKQVRLNTEALLREKDEAVAKAAHAAALKLEKIESRNETLIREIQTAKETADAEIERMKSTLKSTTASLKKVSLQNEKMARDKVELASRAKLAIIHEQSQKAALVTEQERTSAVANRELTTLNTRLEHAFKKIETIRHTTGLERAKLQLEIQAKTSELAGLKKNLIQVQADMATRDAQRAAEVHRLSREKDEVQAREAALLEKLQAVTALGRPRAEMHLAFLINCGLIRPEDYSPTFMPQGRS